MKIPRKCHNIRRDIFLTNKHSPSSERKFYSWLQEQCMKNALFIFYLLIWQRKGTFQGLCYVAGPALGVANRRCKMKTRKLEGRLTKWRLPRQCVQMVDAWLSMSAAGPSLVLFEVFGWSCFRSPLNTFLCFITVYLFTRTSVYCITYEVVFMLGVNQAIRPALLSVSICLTYSVK